MMRTASVLMLCLAALSCAQDAPRPGGAEKKRLGSVTWDLKSHKLIWTVEKGTVNGSGEFTSSGQQRYEITPDEAIMQVSAERRGFTKEEAKSLHKLLDTLSMYCAESVVWWDRGEGTKLEGGDGDKVKIDHENDPHKRQPEWRAVPPPAKPRPKESAPKGELIALLRLMAEQE